MNFRKTLIARGLCIYLTIGLVALSQGIEHVFADELSQINQDASSVTREFVLPETSDVYNVSDNTGNTAAGIMSVIGSLNTDLSEISIINYGDSYSGFVVGNDAVLNLNTVKILNAYSSAYGAVVNNSGALTISSVIFEGNRVINNSANVAGGVIYNTGSVSSINADFTNNGVSTSSYGKTAYGGAIYNDGTINVVSGNFINNYAVSDRGTALGGAIYTTTSLTLSANNEDYRISGNSVTSNGIKDNQAIYVANEKASLTISATNGGSWIIDDSIDGDNGYNIVLTGDNNSFIKLNSSILNAQVNVNNINLYISENTFDNSNDYVYVNGSSVISMLDDRAVTYTFNMLDTTLGDANFEFDIDAADGASDCISVGSSSIGAIKISNLNFLNGVVKSGSYKLLTANNDNVYLELTKDHYSYTNITPVLKWNAEVDAYDYDLSLIKSNGITFDTVVVDMLNDGIRQDNLSALNQYKTTFDRQFIFDSASDLFTVTADTGVSANLSSLMILGQANENNYSTVDYNNNFSGFVMSSGSELTIKNVVFQNAYSSENGSVINIDNSNVSVDYSNGRMVSNFSLENGGALHIAGNSFLRVDNIEFVSNTAKSGGAIYSYSDGIYSSSITGITGMFDNNSAKEFGGAIANYTDYSNGSNYSRISTIIADFKNNSIMSSTNAYGGAIYNTGSIDSVTGDFINNSIVAEQNAYGGALANSYVKNDSGIYRGTITDITSSSFVGNSVISKDGVALGGAIYTANNLVFNINNESAKISENYTIDMNGKTSNAIFVDTTNSSSTLSFNLGKNSLLEISDIIDGGYFDISTNSIHRGNYLDADGNVINTKYNVFLQGDSTGRVIFNDACKFELSGDDYVKTDEVVSGIVNANVTVSDVELVMGTKTFADGNTSLVINSGVVNMQDSKSNNYYINNLVSTTLVDYKLDFNVSVDDNGEVVVNTDKIYAGENSSGTIRITDIGMKDVTEFYDAVDFISKNSPNEYIDITILERANSSDSIKIDVDFSITDNPKVVTIAKDYYDSTAQAYVVTNNSFIGTKGFKLNESADSFRIGVLNREDTLCAINQFEDGTSMPVSRIFNMEDSSDIYLVKEDLGNTSAGSLTINGNGAIIDLDGNSGFILSNDNTEIFLNDISVEGASVALEANILSETSGVVVENSLFKDNDVAISNNEGNILLKNSEIAGSDRNQFNKINNSANGYIISENSKLYSSIVNNGTLTFSGTNVVGKDGANINISGNGQITTTDSAVLTDLRYALVTDPIDGDYNVFTLTSGVLKMGTITFANSKFIAQSGVIDLSGSEDGTLVHVDQPYNIGTYICDYVNGADASFIIDIDFLNRTADQIVITDENSYGVINVAQINGIESLSSFTEEGTINILSSASPNVELKINLEQEVYRFYIDSYLEEDRDEYVLYEDSFVGEIKLTTTDTGIEISRNPIYDALVELNQLGKYQEDTDKSKTRTFILKTSDVVYCLPEKIGETYPGIVNVRGAYDIID
ncbi:MAG: hypothetical protein NC200_02905, partial [Candidatus Gastranaerophilales bacterium]|nr:hypothetical protein [Candidatus Gastranaerophilales bacterium]